MDLDLNLNISVLYFQLVNLDLASRFNDGFDMDILSSLVSVEK